MTARTHIGDAPALLVRAAHRLAARAADMRSGDAEADRECHRLAGALRHVAQEFERRVEARLPRDGRKLVALRATHT